MPTGNDSPAQSERQGVPAALQALCLIARLHQVPADPANLMHQFAFPAGVELRPSDLLQAAKHLGLKARLHASTRERLALVPLPAIALLTGPDGGFRYVILAQCDGQRVLYQDPSQVNARPTIEPLDVFENQWTGQLILVARPT